MRGQDENSKELLGKMREKRKERNTNIFYADNLMTKETKDDKFK